MNTNDWRVATAAFAEMFGPYVTSRRPTGLRGTNFITPDLLGNLLIAGEAVEVTTGMMLGRRVYGVTWSRPADGLVDERDRMCFDLDEVRDLLMRQDGFAADPLP